MRYMLRWWETMGRPERIVAMALVTSGVVGMVNSTVWAIATSYMAHEKARVAIAAAQAAGAEATAPPAPANGDHEQFTGLARTNMPTNRR